MNQIAIHEINRQAPAVKSVFSMPLAQEMTQLINMSETLAKAPFYQKMGSGGVLAIWLTAKELNLPPMTCLNGGLYTFDGKVTMSAQLMNMMIINAGHKANVIELTDRRCEIHFVRCDRQGEHATFKYEFNIEMAQKAGYMSKANWKNHTRDMLFSRCLSGGARKFMPDALMNCYVFGEIEDIDAHLVNAMPDISIIEVEKTTAEKIELKSEPVKVVGHDEFLKKHNVVEGTDIYEYFDHVCSRTKKNRINIINQAVEREESFMATFQKWLSEKTPVESENTLVAMAG